MTTEKNEIVSERGTVYGDPVDAMKLTAQVWSGILDFEVRPDQVPLLLMGLKLVRTSACPQYSDNSDDIGGYLDIFRKVMGDDLIQARTVSEFLEKGIARDLDREAALLAPEYRSAEHTTDCIASMAVKAGDRVQCVCTSGHTAGIWFQLTDRSGL